MKMLLPILALLAFVASADACPCGKRARLITRHVSLTPIFPKPMPAAVQAAKSATYQPVAPVRRTMLMLGSVGKCGPNGCTK